MTKMLFGSTENDDQEVPVNAAKSIEFESKKRGLEKTMISIQDTSRFKKSNLEKLNLMFVDDDDSKTTSPEVGFASKIINNIELDGAATKLQKVYKSYRTRRNLADCAVVVHELWWKALEFAALSRNSSVCFFESDKTETAVSRWARARIMAAKVGRGSSKDEMAQNLALRHWLEAIDPRHRYGHNLHFYYKVWIQKETYQPFFYWLDVGDGKEVNLDDCPRTDLQQQCIKYLGPKEREAYEVVVENGKLVYKQSRLLVSTVEGSKWIFVLGTSGNMYVGEKKKGHFQHSSFLAGGATIASGRLVVQNGLLQAIWAYSGHYKPTEENFSKLISFLEEHNVELTNVKKFPIDDDIPPVSKIACDNTTNLNTTTKSDIKITREQKLGHITDLVIEKEKPLDKNWSTGAGPRISCVRDYPTQLQFQALENVKLSPRVVIPGRSCCATNYKNGAIPSPKP